MKHLIIYHADCLDGFGAAWVAYNALREKHPEDEIELFEGVYGNFLCGFKTVLNKEVDVYILDFSYSPEMLVELCACVNQVIWLDHHKTAIDAWLDYYKNKAFEYLPKNLYRYLYVNHSGAMLTWHYFYPNKEAPLLIKHIEDRDLWLFKLPETKAFIANLNTYKKDIALWDDINYDIGRKHSDSYREFCYQGLAVLRAYIKQVENIISSSKRYIVIDSLTGLCCNAPHQFSSDIGNTLATESRTFGATYYTDKEDNVVFSLRSIGDFDVSYIAKRFGGGGHKNAAGFTLKPENWNSSSSVKGLQLWSYTTPIEVFL